jgi:hypothetical protein
VVPKDPSGILYYLFGSKQFFASAMGNKGYIYRLYPFPSYWVDKEKKERNKRRNLQSRRSHVPPLYKFSPKHLSTAMAIERMNFWKF